MNTLSSAEIKPTQFGIYYVSADEYIKHFGKISNNTANKAWLTNSRPFVCLYHNYHPFFAPLYSIRKINGEEESFEKKLAKWKEYAFRDLLQGTQSFVPFEGLLNNVSDYFSIVRLNKLIPIPSDMLIERKNGRGNLVKIPLKQGLRLASVAENYFNKTNKQINNHIPIVGYLATFGKKEQNSNRPPNYPLLLKATLEYTLQKKKEEKQKQQNEKIKSEEREK